MERSLVLPLRLLLPAKSVLAFLAALGLLLSVPTAALNSTGATSMMNPAASAISAATATVSIAQSHAVAPPQVKRVVLVRYAGPRGWPIFAISAGPLLAPATVLLELAGSSERVGRSVLGFVGHGRGPPQPAGT